MTTMEQAATDVGTFAEVILRSPLWPHQLELARSPARYRAICAGRQSGKSTALAVIALHQAATRRNSLVLLVSSGEVASRRLLDECTRLATSSPLLGGSVLDESKSQLTLSNGSRVLSVPASQRQIRGWPVDLLILDEAGFIDGEVWRAAEPAIIARPGSRVILSSSPWGGVEHFFRATWMRGMDTPDEHVAGWHWPSSISPLVDQVLLEQIRQREPADYFAREFMAEWTDASGAFFSEDELMGATVDYLITAPEELAGYVGAEQRTPTVGGVDYGLARDANAVALIGLLEPRVASDRRWRLFVPWLRAEYGWAWDDFLSYLDGAFRAYGVRVGVSERNGVGAYPSDDLQHRLRGSGTRIAPVWTDVRRKQSGFSKIKMLLQGDRLILPRHPELLKQLRALEFEQTTTGLMKIAVPERAGHDDLAMALMQAVSAAETRRLHDGELPFGAQRPDPERTVFTPDGVAVPRRPIPSRYSSWIRRPSGHDDGDGW